LRTANASATASAKWSSHRGERRLRPVARVTSPHERFKTRKKQGRPQRRPTVRHHSSLRAVCELWHALQCHSHARVHCGVERVLCDGWMMDVCRVVGGREIGLCKAPMTRTNDPRVLKRRPGSTTTNNTPILCLSLLRRVAPVAQLLQKGHQTHQWRRVFSKKNGLRCARIGMRNYYCNYSSILKCNVL
jgi:hypothetical protein